MFNQAGIDKIKKTQERIPIVSDKALIDLVQSVEINRGQLNHKKTQTKMSKLIDFITGESAERQLLIAENYQTSLESIMDLSMEMIDKLTITTQCVQVTQKSLLEVRSYIRKFSNQFSDIDSAFLKIENQFQEVRKDFEAKLKRVEIRITANEKLDSILSAWESDRTYTKLPLLLQILFVVKELFSSEICYYERKNENDKSYRQRIIDKILNICKQREFPISLTENINLCIKQLQASDLQLVTPLLNTYPHIQIERPMQFLLESAIEMSSMPDEIRPADSSGLALALTQNRYSSIDHIYKKQDLITFIVNEIADESLQVIYDTE
jgi:type III secretion system FlhB-like substrate exporter